MPNTQQEHLCYATRQAIKMKINKTIFWTFSIVIALLSCYLFQLSSVQLYSDGNYMQSLNLPSDADTPAVAIAGTVILSIGAVIGHVILLGIFLIIAFLRHKEIEISLSDFVINPIRNRLTKTIFQTVGFLLTAYWLWDFIDVTKIKFFPTLLIFTLLAIAVTWTYMLWLINLTKKIKETRSTNTQQAHWQ
jgi:hypothetical protein